MSGKSELRIFDEHPPQVAVDSGIFQDVYPVTALDATTNVIEFLVQGSQEDYLDLNDTLLSIRVKVVKPDGKPLVADEEPTPANYFMHTLFSDISMYLNDTQIEGGDPNYPYKAIIESLFNFDDASKAFQLLPAGYSDEEDERKKWIANSKEFELVGALRLDFFNQPKYLLSKVSMRIRMTLNKAIFSLKKDVGEGKPEPSYKIIPTHAILYVRRVKVSPRVEEGHAIGLQTKNAIYPYTRTKTITYSIPAGTVSFNKENLFSSGLLPKMIIIGMVNGEAYNGSLAHDPTFFEHFNVSHVALYRDGQMIPYKKAYTPNFKTAGGSKFTDTYVRSIIQNMQLLNVNRNNGITMTEFAENGCCFFTFNLTPDFDMNQPQLARDSNLRLELRFRKQLESAINVIAYATYDAEIQVTKDRRIISNVHA